MVIPSSYWPMVVPNSFYSGSIRYETINEDELLYIAVYFRDCLDGLQWSHYS